MAQTLNRSIRWKSQARLMNLRNESNKAKHIVDPDNDSSDSSSSELDLIAFRRIEDAIQRIIARRAAPDWLPFVPGSSYWVPPPRNGCISQLIDKMANSLMRDHYPITMSIVVPLGWPSSSFFLKAGIKSPREFENPMSREEVMSLTTVCGWPSSAYFVLGESLDLIEVQQTFENTSQSEDEEG